MSDPNAYDELGVGYADARRPDPHIAAQVRDAIGDVQRVLNVGAGTGNYEPDDALVIALEPSVEMIRQRTSSNPVVRSVAEAIPFPDHSFDCVLAFLTVHHWTDREAGLRELGRVAERQVVVGYDTSITSTFWLIEYFAFGDDPREADAPNATSIGEILDVTDERALMIPAECTDGLTGAYWNRPERYLEPAVQLGMSTLARLTPEQRAGGTDALAADLASGEWDRRHGHLRDEASLDIGYRLILCG